MALPNGDLVTTVFNPQMAYPLDKRMQIDTLNSRDSMSMFIRWEGMEVYVLENSTKYILQGGISNEYWKELGTGSGTGGTTFVGQFATADLLPTTGRSAGDYAFVGTGDDFVQYNWDNIANEWVMVEGQTDMASEFFHIGYKTPLRRPVIFPLFPKDVLVETAGDFVFEPETSVARFIFVGEVEAIRGIETAESDREIKLVNRTGSDIPLRDKASGIPSGSGMDFGGSDYTWVNGSEITLKGNGTYWELAPNNQVAFSDHIDSVNAKSSFTADNLEIISGLLDRYTKQPLILKETLEVPTLVDGIINIQRGSKYFKRALKEYNLGEFNVLPENTASENAANFAFAQTVIPHDSKVILPTGVYLMDDVTITKSGIYDFSGVTIINNLEIAGNAITIDESAEYVEILGLKQEYTGVLYTSNPDYSGAFGVSKFGIVANNEKTILNTCRATGFSQRGFQASNTNKAFYLFNCTSNRNGYAGCASNGTDFQVLGGEYSYNGGTSSVRDGYGIIGNVSYNANFKVIGATAVRNASRNIDSHQGLDLIICNNYTSDAGQPDPQWFNNKDTGGLNIRVKQRINKCIISGNVAKRGALAGISVSANSTEEFVDNVIISNNIVEDNLYQIYIRQLQTKRIKINGNVEINNSNAEYPVNWGLAVNPIGNTDDRMWIEELGINGNSFESPVSITMSSNPSITRKSKLNITGNDFELLTVDIKNIKAKININGGSAKRMSFYGTNTAATLKVSSVDVDVNGEENKHLVYDGFAGHKTISGNNLMNSNIANQVLVTSNTDFYNNKIFISHELNPSTSRAIEGSGSNYRIRNNEIIYLGVTPFNNPIRFTADDTVIIKDNIHSGGVVIDYPGGSSIFTKVKWDSLNGTYDFGTSVAPSLGSYSGFKQGDIVKINSVEEGGYSNYIYSDKAGVLTWVQAAKIGYNLVRMNAGLNISLSSLYINKYARFTGAGSGGNITVLPDQFPENYEQHGEIEGGAKTFVAGTGVTLRYPDGQGLVAPTGSRFIIKFKSPNDALVTIIKPYTGATTFNELTDTPASKTGNKNKTVKVSNNETTHVYVADGVDVRDVAGGGSIAIELTDGFISSRLNFTSSTAVTLQGLSNANGQTSLIVVNPHASNDLTIVHNGSGTVKYISPTSTDLVVGPKTAVRLEIVGNEMYPLLYY